MSQFGHNDQQANEYSYNSIRFAVVRVYDAVLAGLVEMK